MRTRVLDMVLDEYKLEGTYPGTLEMAGEVNEIYEWMQGPLASHFMCPIPPAANASDGTKSMCYLPDGSFISDNLIELRQLRVKPQHDTEMPYFTDVDRRITINGGPVSYGGKYSEDANRDTGPHWILPPLNLTFEEPKYRSHYGHWIEPTERWGWYDQYAFGGFVFRTDPSANASRFREQVNMLKRAGWIDRYTRAIAINAVLLNPATGFGALVTVLVETARDGVIRITPDVLVMQRTQNQLGFDILNQHAFTSQSTFFFYCLLTQLSRWFYKGTRAYFSRLGNVFEILIVVIVGYIVTDFMRIDYRLPDLSGSDAAQQMLRAGYTMNYTMQHASTLYGVLLWMLILRLLKFVPHLLGSRHHLFSHTVEKSAVDLLSFVRAAAVILAAFTCIFHFTLGAYLPEFATLPYAFFTVVLGLSSVWEAAHWYDADPFTAVILLLVFTAICTWMLATMVIAIVTESFVAAKADLAIQDRRVKQELERERAEWMDWVHDSESSERLRGEAERGGLEEAALKRKLQKAMRLTRSLARFVEPSSSRRDSVEPKAVKKASGASPRPSPITKASSALKDGQQSEAKITGFVVKGCLWRGNELLPSDEQLANPSVRIFVQGPPVVSGPVSPSSDAGSAATAAFDSQLGQLDGSSIEQSHVVYEEFRSKVVRSIRDKDGMGRSHQAEWNERFALHVPGGLEGVRFVIALFDRVQLGRETLVAYTIVPLVHVARQCGNAIDRSGASGPGNSEQGAAGRHPVMEFTLHAAGAMKKSSGLNAFLKHTASGRGGSDALFEPKLQLSLAVHREVKRRVGWQGMRGFCKSPTGKSAPAKPAHAETLGRAPLLQGGRFPTDGQAALEHAAGSELMAATPEMAATAAQTADAPSSSAMHEHGGTETTDASVMKKSVRDFAGGQGCASTHRL